MSHLFALFYENLGVEQRSITITDATCVHRISRVLRLRTGDVLTLFNAQIHASATITTLTNKLVTLTLSAPSPNQPLKPVITVALGLLKPDALHTAIYALAELGINTIQLYTSEKTQRTWGDKELQRLHRVAVAAAEQSKHFAMPAIQTPISVHDLCKKQADIALLCEPNGQPLVPHLLAQQPLSEKTITLVIGPEGDLTDDEKKMLAKHYTLCQLTQTVLRSEQAATLAAGILRCL